jgi:hypothetical protein
MGAIILGECCMVIGNMVCLNDYAIDVSWGSTVMGNTVSAGEGPGIVALEGCFVQDNTVNTIRQTQTGIVVGDAENAIEENLVTYAQVGIDFANPGNFFANNRCAGCGTCFGGSVPTGSGDGGGNRGF